MTKKLREKIDLIFDGCYSQDLSACPNHTIFQRGKAVNEILPLIEVVIKEAKQEEGERIFRTIEYQFMKEGKDKLSIYREVWQALKEEK